MAQRVAKGYDISKKILSIHGFSESDWITLITVAGTLNPGAVELNVSCPNVGPVHVTESIFECARKHLGEFGIPVIVKLPPVNYERMMEAAHHIGDCRWYHLCNTLPTPGGGLSGKPLKVVSLEAIRRLNHHRATWEHFRSLDMQVIGGGGITEKRDVWDYRREGCTYYAVASMLLNPLMWIPYYRRKRLRELREAATGVLFEQDTFGKWITDPLAPGQKITLEQLEELRKNYPEEAKLVCMTPREREAYLALQYR